MLRCSTCKGQKDEAAFNRNRASKTGFHTSCKACRRDERRKRLPKYREYQRGWVEQNRERQRENAAAHYARFREYLDECKNVPCARCAETHPPYVMDFHHRDPAEKSFTIGKAVGVARALLTAEIAKCDVLCANCHRAVEHELRAQGGEAGPVVATAAA